MIDFEKIPKEIYLELVDLIGEEEAKSYVIKNNYHYKLIVNKILWTRIKLYYKKKPIVLILVIAIIFIILIFYILDLFLII